MRVPALVRTAAHAWIAAALMAASCGSDGSSGGSAAAPAPDATPIGIDQARYVVAQDATAGDDNPGTVDRPFRTIARAAEVARAGDLVVIRPGTYTEEVRVRGEGEPGRPIVFAAERPGTVVLTGAGSFRPVTFDSSDTTASVATNHHVTLRGLVFQDLTASTAIRAATGWRIEDCRLSGGPKHGINIRGHDVVVERTTIEDFGEHALLGYGGRNIVIRQVVIRRTNTGDRMAVPHSAVTKFGFTNNLLVEDVESYENHGPGFWLDFHNRNYTIRRLYSHDNAPTARGQYWEGGGLWLEVNEGPGLVEDSRFERNTGAGLGILESQDVTVRNSVFADNGHCIDWRNMSRPDDGGGIKRPRVVGNVCRSPRREAMHTSSGEWTGDRAPSANGYVIDRNRYEVASGVPLFDWLGLELHTLEEVRGRLGFEQSGASGVPGP